MPKGSLEILNALNGSKHRRGFLVKVMVKYMCVFLIEMSLDSPLVSGYASLVNVCFENDKMVMEDAKTYLESLTPTFKSDRVFQNLFPIVFNIEMCKRKISNSDS